jgi:hypothetical protein
MWEAFLRGAGLTDQQGNLLLVGLVALILVGLVVLGVILAREADNPRWARGRCRHCSEAIQGTATVCGRCGLAQDR